MGGQLGPVGNRLLENSTASGAVHRLEDIAGFTVCRAMQLDPAADLTVRLFDAMTDNAGDSFSGNRMSIQVAVEYLLSSLHAHGRVTADAEITVGPVGQLKDSPVHRVEDGTELSIGVGRNRPLAVLSRVTFFAPRG